ncbi:hypothetical protein [Stetteria hydrogenophila]
MRLDRVVQAYVVATALAAVLASLRGAREGLEAMALLGAAPVVALIAAGLEHSRRYLPLGFILLALWLYRLKVLLH